MRNSLKKLCLEYLKSRYPDWVEGGIIEDFTKGHGYSASNGLRRCRELENEGSIKADYYRGSRGEKLVKYRFSMPSDDKGKREFLKSCTQVKIITLPTGERIAKEYII